MGNIKRVNLITTWDIKCGIAKYSEFLKSELDKFNKFEIVIHPIKKPKSINPISFIKLIKEIENSQIVHIQYQPSIFGRIPIPFFHLIIFLC